MRRARLLLVCLMALSSCANRQIVSLEVGDLPVDYAFIAMMDSRSMPTRLTKPFQVHVASNLPSLALRDDEASFVLVGFTAEDLRAQVPAFDATRAEELSVSLNPPPSSLMREPGTIAPKEASALPDHSSFLTGPLEHRSNPAEFTAADHAKPVLEATVTLSVPIDPEYCRLKENALAPFAEDINPFQRITTSSESATIRQLRWLDADRLLVLSREYLAIVTRGKPLSDPSQYVANLIAARFALEPAARPDGSRHAFVLGLEPRTSKPVVFEAVISGTRISTVAMSPVPTEELHDIAVSGDGRIVVGDGLGGIFKREPGEIAFTRWVDLPLYYTIDPITRLAATGDDAIPFVATTKRRVHLYQSALDQWTYEELEQEGFANAEPLTFSGIAAGTRSTGDREIWVGAQRGNLFRRVNDGGFARVMLDLPPRFEPCASMDSNSSRIVYQGRYFDLTVDGDYLHLVGELCTAVLQVRRDPLLCTSVLERDGVGVMRTESEYYGVAVADGHIAVGGAGGILLSSSF